MGRRLIRAGLAVLLAVTSGCAASEPRWLAAGPPELTLTFAGDVHFERRVDRLLADPGTVFGSAGTRLAAGHLTFVNLETPITGRGAPEAKRYLFRARDAAVRALGAGGVDVVSLANNHTLDYGRQGLADTIVALRDGGVGAVGAGPDAAAAYRPWRADINGVRLAVVAFSQVDDLAEEWAAGEDRAGVAMAFETRRVTEAVRHARASSDLVVALVHWGEEGDSCPDRRQRAFAELLVAAGADVIVGAHAHVLQGAGRLGDAYVAYGLGNFLWYSPGLFPPHSSRAGILQLTVRGREVVRSELVPTVVSDTGQPQVVTGWAARLARESFAGLRECAGLGGSAV